MHSAGALEHIHHFAVFGKATQFLLGKQELPVVFNLEHSPGPSNKIRLQSQFPLQLFRQPGGPGLVVSLTAVRNLADFHGFCRPPSSNHWSRGIIFCQVVPFKLQVPHDSGPHQQSSQKDRHISRINSGAEGEQSHEQWEILAGPVHFAWGGVAVGTAHLQYAGATFGHLAVLEVEISPLDFFPEQHYNKH